jgi:hypothetical protein
MTTAIQARFSDLFGGFKGGPVPFIKKRETIEQRFNRYHKNNPEVYNALVALARDFRQKSHRKIGIKMLFEVLRWNYYLTINTDEEYKLSNDFTAHYARIIMMQEPDLKDAFNLRLSKADTYI